MNFINFIFSDFLGQNVPIPQYQNVSQRAVCPNTPNLVYYSHILPNICFPEKYRHVIAQESKKVRVIYILKKKLSSISYSTYTL